MSLNEWASLAALSSAVLAVLFMYVALPLRRAKLKKNSGTFSWFCRLCGCRVRYANINDHWFECLTELIKHGSR